MLYGSSGYRSDGHYLWSIFYLSTISLKIQMFSCFFSSKITMWSNKSVQTWTAPPFNEKKKEKKSNITTAWQDIKILIVPLSRNNHSVLWWPPSKPETLAKLVTDYSPFHGSTTEVWQLVRVREKVRGERELYAGDCVDTETGRFMGSWWELDWLTLGPMRPCRGYGDWQVNQDLSPASWPINYQSRWGDRIQERHAWHGLTLNNGTV